VGFVREHVQQAPFPGKGLLTEGKIELSRGGHFRRTWKTSVNPLSKSGGKVIEKVNPREGRVRRVNAMGTFRRSDWEAPSNGREEGRARVVVSSSAAGKNRLETTERKKKGQSSIRVF